MLLQANNLLRALCLCLAACLLTACGFHLQGETHLAPPLHRMYLRTPDPYGHLAQDLEQYLKMSKVQLVSSPDQATTILSILKDTNSQVLLSVSATQQTRQYNLINTVEFEITDSKGRVIITPQTFTESRAITIQANQILGSSNEATLYYQQMRLAIAYAIMNRLASQEVTHTLMKAFP